MSIFISSILKQIFFNNPIDRLFDQRIKSTSLHKKKSDSDAISGKTKLFCCRCHEVLEKINFSKFLFQRIQLFMFLCVCSSVSLCLFNRPIHLSDTLTRSRSGRQLYWDDFEKILALAKLRPF